MSDPSPRPPIASAPISAILFARALATDTAQTLETWRRFLDTLNRPYEILLIRETRPEVADDPLPEATARLRVFPYDRTVGFRDVLNDALRSAQYPLFAFAPCDGRYQPSDLGGMLKLIDHVDLVVGYRAGGTPPPWRVLLDMIVGPLFKIILGVPLQKRVCWLGEGWGRRWLARWIFGVHLMDPECPFRLARREVFQRWPMQSGGPFAWIEMLAKANHTSCLFAEEAVTFTPAMDAPNEAIAFGTEAMQLFRDPDFGPPPALGNAGIPPDAVVG